MERRRVEGGEGRGRGKEVGKLTSDNRRDIFRFRIT